MRNAILTTIFCLAAPNARAGLIFTDQFRLYGGGVNQANQSLLDFQETGYFRDVVTHSSANANGRSRIKLEHESVIDTNVFKSTTLQHISLGNGTPRIPETGSLLLIVAHFLVEETTTLRVAYDIGVDAGIHSKVEFHLGTDTGENAFALDIDHSTTGSTTITLEPGAYEIFHSLIQNQTPSEISGVWNNLSTISLSVVPTPTTLAAITPLGILATRRRR